MPTLEKFFALSTCIHCRHTKEFLEANNVNVSPTYVDRLNGEERERVLTDMRQYNPQMSFPTLVFSDGKVIVGFQPEAIGKELSL